MVFQPIDMIAIIYILAGVVINNNMVEFQTDFAVNSAASVTSLAG
jgi:predicted small integral membrane protein